MLGDLVSAGLGVQGMSWVTSPAATELEQHVMDWFADLLGLPESFRSTGTGGGVVQDSSSGANLVALLAALHRASGGATVRHGVEPERAHRLRLRRDALLDGEGRPHRRPGHRRRPHRRGRRRPGHAPGALAARHRARRRPRLHPGAGLRHGRDDVDDGRSTRWPSSARSARSTASGCTSTPPTPASAPSSRSCGELQAGVEWADSYTTDAHKWLLTGFDATLFWVADRAALTGALSILPEYLRNAATDAGAVVDFRDWQIPLGRRFRALKLWFVLRWYGAEGLRAHIRVARGARPRSWPAGPTPTSGSTSPPRTRCRWSACGPAGPTTSTPTSPP